MRDAEAEFKRCLSCLLVCAPVAPVWFRSIVSSSVIVAPALLSSDMNPWNIVVSGITSLPVTIMCFRERFPADALLCPALPCPALAALPPRMATWRLRSLRFSGGSACCRAATACASRATIEQPWEEEKIKEFYAKDYGVTFPLTAKVCGGFTRRAVRSSVWFPCCCAVPFALLFVGRGARPNLLVNL